MFLTIALTTAICFLISLNYIQYKARVRCEEKCKELRKENRMLRDRNQDYAENETRRACRDNYKKGLEDGRTCDALYKSILSKYNAKEQVTVMMYGEGGSEGEARNS